MKRILFALVATSAVCFAAPSFAQDDEVQTRFYDFNDMLIDGEFQRPQGMFATERGQARFDSLLELRPSFIDEIENAAHEPTLD